MSRGFPSMTALLGLLAFAGYQHRDKIVARRSGWENVLPHRGMFPRLSSVASPSVLPLPH